MQVKRSIHASTGIEVLSSKPKKTKHLKSAEAGCAAAPKERKLREGTKRAKMIAMLKQPGGTTLAEIVSVTGWQQHTVRGAIAGALKKRLGLTITVTQTEDRGRVYRIA